MSDPISPAAGLASATELIAFNPVESGWIAIERDNESVLPAWRVYPLLGYAHWSDGRVTAVTSMHDFDPDLWELEPEVFFSRVLFRKAQGNTDLSMSRPAILSTVSE